MTPIVITCSFIDSYSKMMSQFDINAWKLAIISALLTVCCYAQESNIRLFGGRGSYEGRVEVRVSGQWGTVCNDTWDSHDASVACREFDNRTAIKHDVMYGEGIGPIFYSSLTCTGEEKRLQDCPKFESSVDACQHSQDAGVKCDFKEYDLRLSGGTAPNEGRVEFYYMGDWKPVCASSSWDEQEADVVCRKVGYPNGAQESRGSFGSANASLFLTRLSCTGMENTLDECHSSITTSSTPRACPLNEEDAAVICNPNPEVAPEELSKGAIAGIGVGFGLVIIVCCIFSLNCKCQDCCGKRESDDTDVYQCNTASNADSKVFSTTSNIKSESDNRNDSISDIDPNMFIFAPKVPPAGLGISSNAGGTNGVLSNIDETKEPDREITESDTKVDQSSQEKHVTEDKEKISAAEEPDAAIYMTIEDNDDNDDNDHDYDSVDRVENTDIHKEEESETVTVDLQGEVHFNKNNLDLDDQGNPETGENNYIELDESDYVELVENDYLELDDNRASFHNEDVAGKANGGASTEQQTGAHISITNEDTPLESRDESHDDELTSPSEGAEPVPNFGIYDTRL